LIYGILSVVLGMLPFVLPLSMLVPIAGLASGVIGWVIEHRKEPLSQRREVKIVNALGMTASAVVLAASLAARGYPSDICTPLLLSFPVPILALSHYIPNSEARMLVRCGAVAALWSPVLLVGHGIVFLIAARVLCESIMLTASSPPGDGFWGEYVASIVFWFLVSVLVYRLAGALSARRRS
jgi:hypothetical protein